MAVREGRKGTAARGRGTNYARRSTPGANCSNHGVSIGYFVEADMREDIAAGQLMRIRDDWTPPLAPLVSVILQSA